MPRRSARSSIADSSAKVPDDSPGPRLNVGVPTLSFTRRCVVSTFATSYSIRVCRVDDSIQFSNVDVLDATSCRMAVILPSRVAPIAICCTV